MVGSGSRQERWAVPSLSSLSLLPQVSLPPCEALLSGEITVLSTPLPPLSPTVLQSPSLEIMSVISLVYFLPEKFYTTHS